MFRFNPVVLISLVVLLGLAPGPAHAQTDGFGAGAVVGVSNDGNSRNPVGLSMKGWLSDRHAIAGLTSFVIGEQDDSYWILQGDYLFHNFNELDVEEGWFALRIGAGGQLTVLEDRDNQFALRGPVGVTYAFEDLPVDVFVEVAPTVSITDPSAFRFDGAFGFRFYPSFGPDS